MCGIFGIFNHPKAAELTYLGIHALHLLETRLKIVDADPTRSRKVIIIIMYYCIIVYFTVLLYYKVLYCIIVYLIL